MEASSTHFQQLYKRVLLHMHIYWQIFKMLFSTQILYLSLIQAQEQIEQAEAEREKLLRDRAQISVVKNILL